MDELASTATAANVAPRADRSHASLRSEIRRAWEALTDRTMDVRQLDGMEAIGAWLAKATRYDGAEIIRSIPQIVRGAGWEPTGTAKGDHERYGNQVKRRLDYYVDIGWLEQWEPLYEANGEGRGLRVVVAPEGLAKLRAVSPCSSTGKPTRARRGGHSPPSAGGGEQDERGPGRAKVSRLVSPPSRSADASRAPTSLHPEVGAVGARCARVGRRRRALLELQARSALAARRQNGITDESGVQTLAALPWLAQLDVVALARAAMLAETAIAPRLTVKWQRRMEAAARRIERYANFGAGAAGEPVAHVLALDFVRGGWRDVWAGEPPRSLGAIAWCMKYEANRWRRADRQRRGVKAPTPPAGNARKAEWARTAEGQRAARRRAGKAGRRAS